jgi:hypothetical protein
VDIRATTTPEPPGQSAPRRLPADHVEPRQAAMT